LPEAFLGSTPRRLRGFPADPFAISSGIASAPGMDSRLNIAPIAAFLPKAQILLPVLDLG
jgi:hypothetical protein